MAYGFVPVRSFQCETCGKQFERKGKYLEKEDARERHACNACSKRECNRLTGRKRNFTGACSDCGRACWASSSQCERCKRKSDRTLVNCIFCSKQFTTKAIAPRKACVKCREKHSRNKRWAAGFLASPYCYDKCNCGSIKKKDSKTCVSCYCHMNPRVFKHCGNPFCHNFIVGSDRVSRRRYCSQYCNKMPKFELTCAQCQKPFLGKSEKSYLCSDKCRKRWNSKYRKRCRKFKVEYDPAVTVAAVIKRDGNKCDICGKATIRSRDYNPRQATIDHIIPLSWNHQGHVWSNVRLACHQCNTERNNAKGEVIQGLLIG